MANVKVTTLQDDVVEIVCGNITYIVKHNDIGTSVDVWDNDTLLNESQYYFENDDLYDYSAE